MHRSRLAGFIIDCNTEDLEAAARFWSAVSTWYVMEAPTGQRFCVVTVQRADFAQHAHSWQE